MISFFKHLILFVWLKLQFRKRCLFDFSSKISSFSYFEGANKIYPNSSFSGTMGYGSYIGPNCQIGAKIGRFTSVAPFVRTNTGVHPFLSPYVTSCPMFYSIRRQNGYTFANRNLFEESKILPEIGNDCWIGENVFIIGGIKIGDGAVVLAGAVVTKDVPPYAIVGGVPAQIINYRYDKETIEFLLNLKWWNMDVKWLKHNWELFTNIEELKTHFWKNLYNGGDILK